MIVPRILDPASNIRPQTFQQGPLRPRVRPKRVHSGFWMTQAAQNWPAALYTNCFLSVLPDVSISPVAACRQPQWRRCDAWVVKSTFWSDLIVETFRSLQTPAPKYKRTYCGAFQMEGRSAETEHLSNRCFALIILLLCRRCARNCTSHVRGLSNHRHVHASTTRVRLSL